MKNKLKWWLKSDKINKQMTVGLGMLTLFAIISSCGIFYFCLVTGARLTDWELWFAWIPALVMLWGMLGILKEQINMDYKSMLRKYEK